MSWTDIDVCRKVHLGCIIFGLFTNRFLLNSPDHNTKIVVAFFGAEEKNQNLSWNVSLKMYAEVHIWCPDPSAKSRRWRCTDRSSWHSQGRTPTALLMFQSECSYIQTLPMCLIMTAVPEGLFPSVCVVMWQSFHSFPKCHNFSLKKEGPLLSLHISTSSKARHSLLVGWGIQLDDGRFLDHRTVSGWWRLKRWLTPLAMLWGFSDGSWWRKAFFPDLSLATITQQEQQKRASTKHCHEHYNR